MSEENKKISKALGAILSLILIVTAGYVLGDDFGFSIGFAYVVGAIVCAKL